MEKAKFTFSDGSGADEFFVLEETKINGSAYILVVDSEEDDAGDRGRRYRADGSFQSI